jgi:hypothetical protein
MHTSRTAAGLRSTLIAALGTMALAACGGSSTSASHHTKTGASRAHRQPTTTTRRPSRPSYPPYPRVLPAGTHGGASGFVPAVQWRGRTAVWVARGASGVDLLSFDPNLVELHLHSGTIDAGSTGWRYGPSIGGAERRRVIAAFNGGFRLSTDAGGFESFGRVAVPLRAGLGSIVTYTDGTTDIGAWRREVPAPGKRVASVRQNLPLLIDHGHIAGSVACLTCWGATLGGVSDPARSGLGITADGHLVWAGGEHLTPAQLATALLGARVVRAVELDINPEWVNGYLFGHDHGHGPVVPIPVIAGQTGIPGQFLVPWSRDFFSVVAR